MNSKKILFLFLILVTQFAVSQVKIGENPNQIDSASIVELESTSKAFVLTRVTTAQMQAIKPLRGALVYNTEDDCVFYYTGTTWVDLCNTNANKDSFTFVDNNDGTFTVNYSDGTSFTSSDLTGPAGAQGPAGVDGLDGAQGPQGDPATDDQTLTTNASPGEISISGGNSITLNVNDADSDPANEYNTALTFDGTSVTVTDAGGDQSVDISALAYDDTQLQNDVAQNTTDITTNANW